MIKVSEVNARKKKLSLPIKDVNLFDGLVTRNKNSSEFQVVTNRKKFKIN